MGGQSDQRGPWLLALGALAVGVVALGIEGYRAIRERNRQDESPAGSDLGVARG